MDNFDSIQTHSDHYIAHEYLAYHNHPIYLHQFVDSLNQHQLAYIGDTSFQLSYISWMPHHLREMIDQLSETDYVAVSNALIIFTMWHLDEVCYVISITRLFNSK